MRYLIPTLLILFISTALIAADKKDDKEDPWAFKSKSAMLALKSYNSAIAALNRKSSATLTKMQKEYDKGIKAGRLKLVLALEKSLDSETKKGNLEEAIKVRDALKVIKEGGNPPDAPGLLVMGSGEPKATVPWKTQLKNLIGTWRYEENRTMTFLEDGTITNSSGGRGKWHKEDQRVVIVWEGKTKHGTHYWNSFSFPIVPSGVTGDSWAAPGKAQFTKVK